MNTIIPDDSREYSKFDFNMLLNDTFVTQRERKLKFFILFSDTTQVHDPFNVTLLSFSRFYVLFMIQYIPGNGSFLHLFLPFFN